MTPTAPPVPRRALPCVRCGTASRADDRYTCGPCHRAPETRREILGAQAASGPITDPDWGARVKRRLMAAYGWYGGWNRATRPERLEVVS
mgnify:CR=1 FL=1